MDFIQRLSLYISIAAFAFLVIGLFKPWVMVWWEDVQNRRKVIRIYGTIAIISGLTHLILKWLD
ncbi:hypothetical protein BE21_55040 [Sorangium cellulosum]|uniref:Uncharacterized protein n=1 Tax=Sorangium cellulosum TaxID=56 RepID=A0A150TCH6_SORCE|nr:hypothetical protein BE21_55040 [Sorangium cellulosum]